MKSRITLYLGLCTFLCGFLWLYFGVSEGIINTQRSFIFLALPPLFTVLIAIVIAPLFEEIAFRGWLKQNRLVQFILSLVLFILYSWLFLPVYFIGVALMLGLFVYLNSKYEWLHIRWSYWTGILGSAIVFSLAHVWGETGHVFFALLLLFFGMGLVLAYIRIAYGLRWSILLHFSYNLVLTLPALTTVNWFGNNVLLQKDSPVEITLTERSFWSPQLGQWSYLTADSLSISNVKAGKLVTMLNTSSDLLIEDYSNAFQTFDLQVVGNNINRTKLLHDLTQTGIYYLDTIHEIRTVYTLDFTRFLPSDEQQANPFEVRYTYASPSFIAKQLQQFYGDYFKAISLHAQKLDFSFDPLFSLQDQLKRFENRGIKVHQDKQWVRVLRVNQ